MKFKIGDIVYDLENSYLAIILKVVADEDKYRCLILVKKHAVISWYAERYSRSREIL